MRRGSRAEMHFHRRVVNTTRGILYTDGHFALARYLSFLNLIAFLSLSLFLIFLRKKRVMRFSCHWISSWFSEYFSSDKSCYEFKRKIFFRNCEQSWLNLGDVSFATSMYRDTWQLNNRVHQCLFTRLTVSRWKKSPIFALHSELFLLFFS